MDPWASPWASTEEEATPTPGPSSLVTATTNTNHAASSSPPAHQSTSSWTEEADPWATSSADKDPSTTTDEPRKEERSTIEPEVAASTNYEEPDLPRRRTDSLTHDPWAAGPSSPVQAKALPATSFGSSSERIEEAVPPIRDSPTGMGGSWGTTTEPEVSKEVVEDGIDPWSQRPMNLGLEPVKDFSRPDPSDPAVNEDPQIPSLSIPIRPAGELPASSSKPVPAATVRRTRLGPKSEAFEPAKSTAPPSTETDDKATAGPGWSVQRPQGAAALAGKLGGWVRGAVARGMEAPEVVHAGEESIDDDEEEQVTAKRDEKSSQQPDLLGEDPPAATTKAEAGSLWSRWRRPAAQQQSQQATPANGLDQLDKNSLDWLETKVGSSTPPEEPMRSSLDQVKPTTKSTGLFRSASSMASSSATTTKKPSRFAIPPIRSNRTEPADDPFAFLDQPSQAAKPSSTTRQKGNAAAKSGRPGFWDGRAQGLEVEAAGHDYRYDEDEDGYEPDRIPPTTGETSFGDWSEPYTDAAPGDGQSRKQASRRFDEYEDDDLPPRSELANLSLRHQRGTSSSSSRAPASNAGLVSVTSTRLSHDRALSMPPRPSSSSSLSRSSSQSGKPALLPPPPQARPRSSLSRSGSLNTSSPQQSGLLDLFDEPASTTAQPGKSISPTTARPSVTSPPPISFANLRSPPSSKSANSQGVAVPANRSTSAQNSGSNGAAKGSGAGSGGSGALTKDDLAFFEGL